MRSMPLVIAAVSMAAIGCRASDEHRREVLQAAEIHNNAIVRTTVVNDLRAPADSGRLIYDAPVHLSHRIAPAAGARQVWAPFGISQPDTVAQKTVR